MLFLRRFKAVLDLFHCLAFPVYRYIFKRRDVPGIGSARLGSVNKCSHERSADTRLLIEEKTKLFCSSKEMSD
ncbi:MAG: hypothetical protein NVSMB6_13000 [Burkholderiaceae bacterium]